MTHVLSTEKVIENFKTDAKICLIALVEQNKISFVKASEISRFILEDFSNSLPKHRLIIYLSDLGKLYPEIDDLVRKHITSLYQQDKNTHSYD